MAVGGPPSATIRLRRFDHVTVQKGEGKYMIISGSYRLPVGRDLQAYISRPDLSGSCPTIIVAHGPWGLTSHVKSVCRRLARYGFAAVCPDLYRGSLSTRLSDQGEAAALFATIPSGRAAHDLVEAFSNVEASGTEWSDADRIGILAFGAGATAAFEAAARIDTLAAMALLYAPVSADQLAGTEVSILGLYGAEDELVPAADVRAAREAAGRGEFAFYGGVGHDFVDETRDGYDYASAEDAYGRIIGFFDSKVTTTPAVA